MSSAASVSAAPLDGSTYDSPALSDAVSSSLNGVAAPSPLQAAPKVGMCGSSVSFTLVTYTLHAILLFPISGSISDSAAPSNYFCEWSQLGSCVPRATTKTRVPYQIPPSEPSSAAPAPAAAVEPPAEQPPSPALGVAPIGQAPPAPPQFPIGQAPTSVSAVSNGTIVAPPSQQQPVPQFPPGVKVPPATAEQTVIQPPSAAQSVRPPSAAPQQVMPPQQQPQQPAQPRGSVSSAFPGSLSDLVMSFENVKQKGQFLRARISARGLLDLR